MGSHDVTCHLAAVTFPHLPQPKLVLDLATRKGCKAELTYVVVISDVNKDWTHKDQDKDKDQSHKDKDKDWTHKDKDLTYKDSKQKRRQAQHSFFFTLCH